VSNRENYQHPCQEIFSPFHNLLIKAFIALLLISSTGITRAECFGSGEYQVCSESYTDSNGNIQIRSWDSEGNSYSVNTESYTNSNGSTIRSYDSEGK
jgi:hypothetical protein